MLEEIVVKRYAEAFVDFARGSIGLDKALEDFKGLKSIMRDNPGFGEILGSPQVSAAEKFNFLDRLLGPGFSREFIRFLKFLLDKRRIDRLADIAEYVRAHYAHEGVTEAVLRTSFPLDLEAIQRIKDKLEKKLNKKLKFYIELDGTLLGGVQVVIGNTVFDGSVRRRIQDLKEKLQLIRV